MSRSKRKTRATKVRNAIAKAGKRKTIRDVYAARDRILDEIDDEIDVMPSKLRQALLAELHDCIELRADDVEGYYGKAVSS